MKPFLIGLITGGVISAALVYFYHVGKLAPLVQKVKDYEARLGIGHAP